MHEPIAEPPAAKFARALGVVDALSAAIAGFALFAGTRAFAFLAIVALRQWGEDHLYRAGERHSVLIDRANGDAVARLKLQASDGRMLGWNETQVRKATEGPR